MSVIQISRQTSLTGRPLQEAIDAIIQQLRADRTYSSFNVQSRWDSGTRLSFWDARQRHMNGTVDLTMGPPSTVTVQVNLTSALANSQRPNVERDMIAIATQHLPSVGGAAAPAAGASTTPVPADESWFERRRRERAERRAAEEAAAAAAGTAGDRSFNWSAFGTVLTGLFGAGAQTVNAYNQVGNQAAGEAVAIAQEEAGKQASEIGPNAGLQHGPGFTLGQGKGVAPGAPLPGEQAPGDGPPADGPPVEDVEEVGFPAWGWWAIGLGGAAAIGAVAFLALRDDDKDEMRRNYTPRHLEQPARELLREGYSVQEVADELGIKRPRNKGTNMAQNYGFRYFL